MKSPRWVIVGLLVAFAAGTGCFSTIASKKKSKNAATLRIYKQTSKSLPRGYRSQIVFERPAITFWVDPAPELSERDIVSLETVEGGSGLKIKITFNAHGRFVLENLTGGNRGKYMAVVAGGATITRPIAAIRMNEIIRDGVLIFTPDLTDEQIVTFVAELQKGIGQIKKQDSFNFKP